MVLGSAEHEPGGEDALGDHPFRLVWDSKRRCQHLGPSLTELSGVCQSANIEGNRRTCRIAGGQRGLPQGSPRSISDPQEAFPLAEFALKAHALDNLEARDDAPLDLLSRSAGRFACSPILARHLLAIGIPARPVK